MAANREEDGDSRQLQLSDLPDEILIRILSLLPTEDAVWTCLLLFRRSEQQHLWKFLTRLEFCGDRCFLKSNDPFFNFVNRVMDLRDQSVPLVSFSLGFMRKFDDGDPFTKLITKAVQYNVEELTLCNFDDDNDESDGYSYDVDAGYDDYYYYDEDNYKMRILPYCILECQSLVKLDLESIEVWIPSSVICFPRLKYLRLSGTELDLSTTKLLSAPLLEVLIIHHCYFWCDINVCCPKLQVLNIRDRVFYGTYSFLKICIIADSLKYFSYSGNLRNEYRICGSSSTQLTKVEIDVVYDEITNLIDLGLNCYVILMGLSGSRNLSLSDRFLEGLEKFPEYLDTIPIFEGVTRLDVRVYEEEISINSLALMKIYEKCLHLEYLNIGKLSNTMRNLQLSPVPLCFQTSLKKILVHYYVPGDDKADVAIDVLLNSAFVLEELVVYCLGDEANGFYEGCPKIQELQDRLNRCPRVSEDCIISLRFNLSSYYKTCYVKSMSEP